jgi:hypothetical protein
MYCDVFEARDPVTMATYAMRISYYRDATIKKFLEKTKLGDVRSARRVKSEDSVSISNAFSKITDDFKQKRVTPHYIRVFKSYDAKNCIATLPNDAGMKKRSLRLTELEKKYNHVTIMELFESTMTAFITGHEHDEDVLRAFIFQIVFTIAATQHELPGWRHNDLSTNNILIKDIGERVTKYTCGGRSFYVRTKHLAAIMDYDFVHAPSVPTLQNGRVLSGELQRELSAQPNVSYDVHLFLKSIEACLSKNKKIVNAPTAKFLRRMKLGPENRHLEEIPSLNPLAVLRDEYFIPLTNYVGPVIDEYSFA